MAREEKDEAEAEEKDEVAGEEMLRWRKNRKMK